jgi:hypothetical protein
LNSGPLKKLAAVRWNISRDQPGFTQDASFRRTVQKASDTRRKESSKQERIKIYVTDSNFTQQRRRRRFFNGP